MRYSSLALLQVFPSLFPFRKYRKRSIAEVNPKIVVHNEQFVNKKLDKRVFLRY